MEETHYEQKTQIHTHNGFVFGYGSSYDRKLWRKEAPRRRAGQVQAG